MASFSCSSLIHLTSELSRRAGLTTQSMTSAARTSMSEIDNEYFLPILDVHSCVTVSQGLTGRDLLQSKSLGVSRIGTLKSVSAAKEVRIISAEWRTIVNRTCILPSAIALQMSIFASFF